METEQFRQLMDRAQAGDAAAADCLFVHACNSLHGAVKRLMDGFLRRAGLEPEDVLQETYAAAWPKLATAEFESFPAFVGWLKTIAKNKVIDLRRGFLADKHGANRRATGAAAQCSSYQDLVERVVSSEPTPSRGAACHEAMALLLGQMWRLPEDYRHVIQWRFVQGLSVAEIARRLDRSEATVHTLCHRALKKMKDLIGSPSKYLSTMA